MQSAGGFIIDDLSTVFDDEGGRPAPQAEASSSSNNVQTSDSVATPKPLTSKQEAKLRSFLDGALEDITRGYRKRYDPSSSLHTLTSYLAEWMRLLGVLAHVPPYGGGSTNLLISYLLRCSTELSDGITGYSLAMEVEAGRRERKWQKKESAKSQSAKGKNGKSRQATDADDDGNESESDEEEERQHLIASRTKQLNLALQTIDLLDRVWAAVLRGNLINLPVALGNARKAFPETSHTDADGDAGPDGKSHSRLPYNPRSIHSTSSLVPSPAIDGRFASNTSSASAGYTQRESLPVHGGRGNRTVGVTDQVRLRNIAISSREKLFSWMRTELDAPAPPVMDEHDAEPEANTVEGAMEVKVEQQQEEAGEEEEADMEDVEIDQAQVKEENYDEEEDTEEHRHYNDLFERKLDPDADDDDDEDAPPNPQADGSDQTLGASVLGTVEAATTHGTPSPGKRKRENDLSDNNEARSEPEEPRADGLPSKRPRAADDTDADEPNAKMSRSELGSVNFDLSDAIGQWDLAFTRLFSRTLRTLSDLSEVTARRDKRSDGRQSDFSSSLIGISGADEQEAVDDRS